MSHLQSLSLSPIRLIPAVFEEYNEGFIIYSGITDHAPAQDQYKMDGKVKIDPLKGNKVFSVNSVENCAQICLEESILDDNKCLSFDFCRNIVGGFLCSMYNTTLTDSEVISDSASECQHYSSKSS